MNIFEKNVLFVVASFIVVLLLCKISLGLFAGVFALIGCIAAWSRKSEVAIMCFVYLPMLLFVSPEIVSGPFLGLCVRIGQIALLLSMLFLPSARSRVETIPLGGLFVYSVVAVFSSINGWMPLISLLKIFNFVMFVVGLMMICKVAQESEGALFRMRVVLMSLAVFIIIGSAIAYFIPSIGYSMEVSKAAMWGLDVSGADIASQDGKRLFSGVMNHSQTLATDAPLFFAWVLCDMIFVERKMSRLHVIIILIAPILMYMSRSRTAFVVFFVGMMMISTFGVSHARMVAHSKRKVVAWVICMCIVLVAVAFFAQIKNHMLSRWLRKEDDVAGDTRGLAEAITSSRMGLAEDNMSDFKKNPMLGMGFQVMPWHNEAYRSGQISLLSAPIEKGVLPLMVLGECGIVGGIVFAGFLIVFYTTCVRKRYTVLLCLFTALLAGNMSEAFFFSPGGGTAEWFATVVGGFCIDIISKRRERADLMIGVMWPHA